MRLSESADWTAMGTRRVVVVLLVVGALTLMAGCSGADGVDQVTVECVDGTMLTYETVPASSAASAAHVRWRVGDAPWGYAPTGSAAHTRAVAACTG